MTDRQRIVDREDAIDNIIFGGALLVIAGLTIFFFAKVFGNSASFYWILSVPVIVGLIGVSFIFPGVCQLYSRRPP